MLVRLALFFIIATLLFVGLRMLLARQKLSVRQFFGIYFAALLGLGLLYLGVTGRLHPVFAAIGVILPFIGRLMTWLPRSIQAFSLFRAAKNFMGAGPGMATGGHQKSEINTRFLHMVLFHDTGMMDGEVLEGRFSGARLSDLELPQLHDLLEECRVDGDSFSILEAYLDREHQDWRDGADHADSGPAAPGSNLTEQEAYEILGLESSASRDDVIQAHRRLMQKLHPDRGGSTYLAARLNEAKDLLMERLGKGG